MILVIRGKKACKEIIHLTLRDHHENLPGSWLYAVVGDKPVFVCVAPNWFGWDEFITAAGALTDAQLATVNLGG